MLMVFFFQIWLSYEMPGLFS
ncbi:hypothetical protein GPA_18960 [Gordonibacter pamelaeae 7-10-1-b]|uniref:Uncharacterized protein n=1 Tax=Gordonibacter pamelaeae 7-10-1-b TaxID=657308 RepID=D6E9A5_9ACTN|nr:hypothetical protein GPA_18960 [Gordonibacter pamelaeae 7-10-1-b]